MRAIVLLLPFLALGCSRSELGVASRATPPPEVSCRANLPPIEPPAPLDCTLNGQASTPLLAGIVGSTLFGVSSTGEARALFEFVQAPAFADHALGDMAILSRGRWIAAMLVHTAPTLQSAAFERVIVDLDGSVVFHDQTVMSQGNGPSNSHVAQITGNGRVFAFGFGFLGGGERVDVVTSSGDLLSSLTPFLPLTDPDSNGRVAIGGTDSNSIHDPVWWLDACGDTTVSAYQRLELKPSTEAVGSFLLYPGLTAAELLREDAGGVTRYPLPSVLATSPAVFATHPAGWAVEGSYQHETFAPVNVITGEIRAFDVVVPPDLKRMLMPGIGAFDPTIEEIGVDSGGRLLIGLRDASLGQLYATADGTTFTPIGAPVGNVWAARAVERSGAYLVITEGGTLAPWPPPPAGVNRVDGPSLQLVRPATGSSRVIINTPGGGFGPTYYRMSHDGRCVARLDSSLNQPGRLEIWSPDGEGSETMDLPWSGQPGFNKSVSTFIGGDDATPPVH